MKPMPGKGWWCLWARRRRRGAGRLQGGKLTEAVVRVEDMSRVQGWAFLNSLRGWMGAEMV